MITFGTYQIIDGIKFSGENIIAQDWDEAFKIANAKGITVAGILCEVLYVENGNIAGCRAYDNDFSGEQSK